MDALDSNNSSIQRTIVSRLYYAAFLHARSWLVLNENYESHSAGDHYFIPQFIMKSESLSFKTRENIKNILISLKNNRHYCDYELNNEFYSYLPDRYKFSLDDLIDFSDYIIRTLK